MHRRDQREFDAFVRAVGDRLLHTAELLTGDPVRAERRVNRALARTYLKWRHSAESDPTRIAHRALVAGYLDPWRPLPWRPQPTRGPGRGWAAGSAEVWAGVAPGAGVGAAVGAGEPGSCTDAEAERARDEVLRGLDGLTRLERAVTVLRAYARLDEFDTAEALAVREATVRSAYGRAAARLAAAAGVGTAAQPGGANRRRSRETITWTAGVGVTHGQTLAPGAPDSAASSVAAGAAAEFDTFGSVGSVGSVDTFGSSAASTTSASSGEVGRMHPSGGTKPHV
ncbi:hypothetical protein [Streptodolium elevatio]|uniref:Uncharacterized protein n=1 Tax=Streptodolium elevatio TaxID=3157996 RepID=A0ABV3DL70_9ACTN